MKAGTISVNVILLVITDYATNTDTLEYTRGAEWAWNPSLNFADGRGGGGKGDETTNSASII